GSCPLHASMKPRAPRGKRRLRGWSPVKEGQIRLKVNIKIHNLRPDLALFYRARGARTIHYPCGLKPTREEMARNRNWWLVVSESCVDKILGASGQAEFAL